MNSCISRWAQTLVNYCLEVAPGQTVLITSLPAAEPLIAQVYRETLRAGGHPIVQIVLHDLDRITLEEASNEQLAWIDPAQIHSRRSAAGSEKWCGTLYPTEAYALA